MNALLYIATLVILTALGLVAWGLQLWALVDCLRTPAANFERVSKRTKGFWGGLTGVSALFGLFFLLGPSLGFLMLVNLAGVTVASVYLADVRPALAQLRGGSRKQGPYGPW
ncbi:DUF2516 family protein [Specibacter cremeus]|uniref:DUF2516 family protein n=1 Tax=Specibacter cremeus TaxID=1629051 RepID=UPI000F7A600F|nr:DUF2516 family protein [Specibacter cremeus]